MIKDLRTTIPTLEKLYQEEGSTLALSAPNAGQEDGGQRPVSTSERKRERIRAYVEKILDELMVD